MCIGAECNLFKNTVTSSFRELLSSTSSSFSFIELKRVVTTTSYQKQNIQIELVSLLKCFLVIETVILRLVIELLETLDLDFKGCNSPLRKYKSKNKQIKLFKACFLKNAFWKEERNTNIWTVSSFHREKKNTLRRNIQWNLIIIWILNFLSLQGCKAHLNGSRTKAKGRILPCRRHPLLLVVNRNLDELFKLDVLQRMHWCAVFTAGAGKPLF